jgi:hypothetical protein
MVNYIRHYLKREIKSIKRGFSSLFSILQGQVSSLFSASPPGLCLTPSPFIPLPLEKGKGEGSILREASPLFDSPFYLSLSKGREKRRKRGFHHSIRWGWGITMG